MKNDNRKVCLLSSENHINGCKEILNLHFEENMDIIIPALDLFSNRKHNNQESLLLGVLDSKDNVQACAVIYIKKNQRVGLNIYEIVWYGALEKGLGNGSFLFDYIVNYAKENNIDAILSTSTNTALPFWTSRKGVRIANTILRASDRGPIKDEKIVNKFGFSGYPTSSVMCKLYCEDILRNRKGRVVGQFEGKPYHYGLEVSNHVWYILNNKLAIKSVKQ